MGSNFEISDRYRELWQHATNTVGPIIPTVEQPYVEGSLRPQTTSLCAEIGGTLVHLTDGEVAFGADQESVIAKLTALEELQAA